MTPATTRQHGDLRRGAGPVRGGALGLAEAPGDRPRRHQPLALLPFVTWAATGEVVEDAEMFGAALAPTSSAPGYMSSDVGRTRGRCGNARQAEGDNGPNGRDLEVLASGMILCSRGLRHLHLQQHGGQPGHVAHDGGMVLALAFVWNSSQLSGCSPTSNGLPRVGGT